MQGRIFLDTPGTCADNATQLAQELTASSLLAADAASVVGMRMWPVAVAVEITGYGNLDIRSLEMALTSGPLSGLEPVPGNASVLMQVHPLFCISLLVRLANSGTTSAGSRDLTGMLRAGERARGDKHHHRRHL